jgi:cleavage stimulation factor subunit 1
MLAKSTIPQDMMQLETPQQQMENHPVIRTLYDHTNVSLLNFFA